MVPAAPHIKVWTARPWLRLCRMSLFMYHCPKTGYRVQGFVAEDTSEDQHVYEAVTVFRLITSSNLVACSTGTSATLLPRKSLTICWGIISLTNCHPRGP